MADIRLFSPPYWVRLAYWSRYWYSVASVVVCNVRYCV